MVLEGLGGLGSITGGPFRRAEGSRRTNARSRLFSVLLCENQRVRPDPGSVGKYFVVDPVLHAASTAMLPFLEGDVLAQNPLAARIVRETKEVKIWRC